MGVQDAVEAVSAVGAGPTAEGILVGTATAAPYVPSPMDYSLLWPQLVSLGFVAVCLAYWQIILVPTAQVKFNLQDQEKRKFIKELQADDDRPIQQWLYTQWLKPLARPRGDQLGAGLPGRSKTQATSESSDSDPPTTSR